MYLTHIDRNGLDSRQSASTTPRGESRVNIPEFVNVAPAGYRALAGRRSNTSNCSIAPCICRKHQRFEEAIVKWKKLLELSPDDEAAHQNLGMLLSTPPARRGARHIQKAKEFRLRHETMAIASSYVEPTSSPVCSSEYNQPVNSVSVCESGVGRLARIRRSKAFTGIPRHNRTEEPSQPRISLKVRE